LGAWAFVLRGGFRRIKSHETSLAARRKIERKLQKIGNDSDYLYLVQGGF
jgi:hypothetical protein